MNADHLLCLANAALNEARDSLRRYHRIHDDNTNREIGWYSVYTARGAVAQFDAERVRCITNAAAALGAAKAAVAEAEWALNPPYGTADNPCGLGVLAATVIKAAEIASDETRPGAGRGA